MQVSESVGFFVHQSVVLHIQRFRQAEQEIFVFIFRREERIVAGRFRCTRLNDGNAKDWLFEQLRALADDRSILCHPNEHCADCALKCEKIADVLHEWLADEYAAFLATAMNHVGGSPD